MAKETNAKIETRRKSASEAATTKSEVMSLDEKAKRSERTRSPAAIVSVATEATEANEANAVIVSELTSQSDAVGNAAAIAPTERTKRSGKIRRNRPAPAVVAVTVEALSGTVAAVGRPRDASGRGHESETISVVPRAEVQSDEEETTRLYLIFVPCSLFAAVHLCHHYIFILLI